MAGKGSIKVTKGGPYQVMGSLPLTKMVIDADTEGIPLMWRRVETYPQNENYLLCRCGKSKNKPYCDGSHTKNNFEGSETADRSLYLKGVKVYEGPELKLTDKRELCVGAGFCTRAGNIWNLTINSDTSEYKSMAIQEAADCPSGRLVEWDKKGKPFEPTLEAGIAVIEDQDGIAGPLWVMGGVKIEASDGYVYERRNRVTLCRCGRSESLPLCDGSHFEEET
ncbi:MAG: CDGSH iron-sulfur domain-containing protein [Candidatus Bathyarchaeia archaeon]|jgi:CDGSH-type Zn-finger protein